MRRSGLEVAPAATTAGPAAAPRIVAFSYNCDPGVGSEGGAGWAWARLLAGIGPTLVITRSLHGSDERVRDRLSAIPESDRLQVVDLDLPRWTRLFTGGHRDRFERLQYLAWHAAALRVARRMNREHPFDLAWHLTWANVWLGSAAALVGPPFVYGPVGGGVGPPWRLAASLGPRPLLAEIARSATRAAMRHLNPLAAVSWRRARLILVQNPETRAWLPAAARRRSVVLPNALFEEPPAPRAPHAPGTTALFAGRLLPWKGASLAVRAIAASPPWRLVVCGDGPEMERLRAQAASLGVADRVEFRGWRPRDEVLRCMREEADVLVFPSLHEEGGWAVAEAAALGLPVVCFDRGGPAVLGGCAVPVSDLDETVDRLARALRATATAPGIARAADPGALTVERRRVEVARLLAAAGLRAPDPDDAGVSPASPS